jgi:2Fe-2S ferredoxin
MISIVFVEHDGTRHDVAVASGVSVMEAAVRNGVPGINADCGGACACATCHVYIAEDWCTVTGEANANEAEMLECSSDVRANSRLSCQIIITPEMNGLQVDLPVSQD